MVEAKKRKQIKIKRLLFSIILSLALVVLINLGTSFKAIPVLAQKDAKDISLNEKNSKEEDLKPSERNEALEKEVDLEKTDDKEIQQEGTYKNGEYLGVGEGYNGPIQVKVLVDKGEISKIDIVYTTDDKEYLDAAEQVIDEVISKQDTDIQAVSGATCTSYGILDAIDQSLDGGV